MTTKTWFWMKSIQLLRPMQTPGKYVEWLMDPWSYRSVMVTDGSIKLCVVVIGFFVIPFFTGASHVLLNDCRNSAISACNISHYWIFTQNIIGCCCYWFMQIWLDRLPFQLWWNVLWLKYIRFLISSTHSIWPERDIRLA